MYKQHVISFVVVSLLLVGCAKELPQQQPQASNTAQPAPIPDLVTSSPRDGAAAAQGLSTDQVLNRALFRGGTLGDQPFHGGEVLLWRPELNRYRLRASLDLGGGQWRSTNNTNEMTFDPSPFIANVALLNDVEQSEQAVPLWAFYGHVENPEIALVEVRIPGIQLQPVDVKRGTWLMVYQGVLLAPGPDHLAEVIAYSSDRKEITRKTIKLQ